MAAETPSEPTIGSTMLGASIWKTVYLPLAISLPLTFYFPLLVSPRSWTLVLPGLVTSASVTWATIVSKVVPEPYLDEVFHVPQAQKYCEGRFLEWDDKITTPPGLYLLSNLIPQALKAIGLEWKDFCGTDSLRLVNVAGLFVLACLFLRCRHLIEGLSPGARKFSCRPVSEFTYHSACNVALFPLLFFFSGLYYTDVISTAVVLSAYANHLGRIGVDCASFSSSIRTIILGILALLMRQTNVFWVVVYMGGLEAVHAIKMLEPARVDPPPMATTWQQVQHYVSRYSAGEIHDPPLGLVWPHDAILTIISLAIAAICSPVRILKQVWPYLTTLVAFIVFVAWNGGVVLGDKSNHVATIHLAQMLYIWPFFAFFSVPLFLPCVFRIFELIKLAVAGFSALTDTAEPPTSDGLRGDPVSSTSQDNCNCRKRKRGKTAQLPKTHISTWSSRKTCLLTSSAFVLGIVALSFVIVRYNTIIHPFTLADNRHYMFYFFRYTIRRGRWIRYLLIMPYVASAWMVFGALGGYGIRSTCDACGIDRSLAKAASSSKSEEKTMPHGDPLEKDAFRYSIESAFTSTGLILLIATSLSLVTAPLVEPRYFIIPWVMWRLQVPPWRPGGRVAREQASGSLAEWVLDYLRWHDGRLVLETLWFVAINLATCFVFLTKPYIWRAEDGRTLDNGRLQRFMW